MTNHVFGQVPSHQLFWTSWSPRSHSQVIQHAAAQSTISVLESKVMALEDLVRSSQIQPPSPPPIETVPDSITAPHPSESLTQILNDWTQSVQGQWSSVRE